MFRVHGCSGLRVWESLRLRVLEVPLQFFGSVFYCRHNLTIVARPCWPRRESCSFGAQSSRFGARIRLLRESVFVRESIPVPLRESGVAVRESAGGSARILGL